MGGCQSQTLKEEVKNVFAENGVKVLKELFTRCARLNQGQSSQFVSLCF